MLFQLGTPSSDAPARGKSQKKNSRQKESKTEQNEG